MARRVDPVDLIVAFFENTPLDQAAMVLTIVKGIVARRQPKATAAKPVRRPQAARVDGADAVVPAHVRTTRGGLSVEEPERT